MPSVAMPCFGIARRAWPSKSMSAVALVKPRKAVEEGGLAGAVGADEADDLAGGNVEGNAVEGDDATEPDGDAVYLEQARVV